MVSYIKLDPIAIFSKAHVTDAGFDMKSMEDVQILPGEQKLIKTGIKVDIPFGYQGILTHRSSTASKRSCEVIMGIIDSGYLGEVLANLKNFSNHYLRSIERGDVLFQMTIVPIYTGEVTEVTEFTEVTERNESGFGSTDKSFQCLVCGRQVVSGAMCSCVDRVNRLNWEWKSD